MTNKIFGLLALSIFVFAFLMVGVSAANLATWDFNATSTTASATSSNANLVASAVTVGPITGIDPGTFTFSANGVTAGTTADGWNELTLVAAFTDNDYYQVTLTPNLGFNFVVNSVSFSHITDDALPGMEFAVRSSEDNFAVNLAVPGVSTTISAIATISNLKLAVGASETITFRIYGFNAATNAIDFSIDNLVISGDLVPVEVVQCINVQDASANNNNMAVDSLDLSVEDGYGEDDEWYPLDLVNVETNVEYNGDSDFEMKSIEAKWGLFDRTTNKWIIDDEEKKFSLDGGDDQDVNIQLKLDEKMDKLATGDIVAYVIVNGNDKEEVLGVPIGNTCEYVESSVTIKSDNTLILDNLQYPTTAVQCSEEVLVIADIWNVGDDKLENTYILVNNNELGINNQKIEVGDVKDFDNTGLSFTFTVPTGIVEKSYNLLFSLYDEDDDIFEIADDESKFIVPISVSGGCSGTSSSATVSANLVSGGQAGQPLVVRATVTNSGTSTANYTVNAAGFGSWASGATLSETTFLLNAGQSKDVTITLATLKGVSGEQTFNVEVVSGSQTAIQPVKVVLESSGFLSSITGGAIGGNGTLWLIGLINVILVIAIIMVAVRFFRK